MTTLVVEPEAFVEITLADAWWRAHRQAAPDLFMEELDRVFAELCDFPELGQPGQHPRHPSARRRIVPRTDYAVFYHYLSEADRVDVVAVWSSRRGRGPFG